MRALYQPQKKRQSRNVMSCVNLNPVKNEKSKN